jgi:hypothetical protein
MLARSIPLGSTRARPAADALEKIYDTMVGMTRNSIANAHGTYVTDL